MYLSPSQNLLNSQPYPPLQTSPIASNTPVLLVCIYNKENHPIPIDDLYQIFSAYGQVLRILLFDKSRVWKAFIEFENSGSALLAKNQLDGQAILPKQIRINVYFSELQRVQFQNKNYRGKDYTIENELNKLQNISKNTQSQDLLGSTLSKESQDNGSKAKSHDDFDANDDILKLLEDLNDPAPKKNLNEEQNSDTEDQDKDEFNDFIDSAFQAGSLTRAFTLDQISSISPQVGGPLSRCSTLPDIPDNFCTPSDHTLLSEAPLKYRQLNRFNTIIGLNASSRNPEESAEQISQSFQRPEAHKKFSLPLRKPLSEISNFEPSSNLCLNSNSFVPNYAGNKENQRSYRHSHCSNFEPFIEETKQSKVLYVTGLDNKNIDVHQICNLFGNFGNIIKAIFIASKKVALVEFESLEDSATAKDFLNNITFMGKPLRITYSKYQNINVKENLSEREAEQVYIEDPRNFRFKKNNNVQINPPSSVLHLSNLTRNSWKKALLQNFLSPYGQVEDMKLIHSENGGNIKNMCLVKFSSVEDSINVMIHLHNTLLDQRHVQISFTRSKI